MGANVGSPASRPPAGWLHVQMEVPFVLPSCALTLDKGCWLGSGGKLFSQHLPTNGQPLVKGVGA